MQLAQSRAVCTEITTLGTTPRGLSTVIGGPRSETDRSRRAVLVGPRGRTGLVADSASHRQLPKSSWRRRVMESDRGYMITRAPR